MACCAITWAHSNTPIRAITPLSGHFPGLVMVEGCFVLNMGMVFPLVFLPISFYLLSDPEWRAKSGIYYYVDQSLEVYCLIYGTQAHSMQIAA